MTESDWNPALLTLHPVLFTQNPVSRLGGSVAAVATAFQLVGLERVEAGREEVLSLPILEEGREAVGGHRCQVLAPMPELEPNVLEAAG